MKFQEKHPVKSATNSSSSRINYDYGFGERQSPSSFCRKVIELHFNESMQGDFDTTLLHIAILENDISEFDNIIANALRSDSLKEVLDAQDSRCATPLHAAAFIGNEEMVRKLVVFKADLFFLDEDDLNPIGYAMLFKTGAQKEIVSLLSEAMKKEIKKTDNLEYMLTNYGNDYEQKIIDSFGKYSLNNNALHYSICENNISLFQLIIAGVRHDNQLIEVINATDKFGVTPLHVAALLGREEMVKELLLLCANAISMDDEGLVPLSYAALRQNNDPVRDEIRIVTNRTIDNLSNPQKIAQLAELVFAEDLDTRFAKYFQGDCLGLVRDGKIEEFREIIKTAVAEKCLDALLDCKDRCGITLLHIASYKGHHAIVKELLELGANPIAEDDLGFVPLSYANLNKNNRAVTLLLEKSCHKALKIPTHPGDDTVIRHPCS